MANSTGGVPQSRIIGVGERCGIGGSWGRLLNVYTQKVKKGPACSRPITVGFRARIAVKKGLGVENASMGIVDKVAVVGDFFRLKVSFLFLDKLIQGNLTPMIPRFKYPVVVAGLVRKLFAEVE